MAVGPALYVQSAGKEGTFAAALDKLDHIVDSGFTAVQLMPVLEFSGSWGYNPRLLFPTHQVRRPLL